MLRLKRIDLHGFKSFADRERLHFPGSGIAAVVGPNGCGKSNICDAVNWVLGEQSAKSLRGGRMRDVIFNGTNKRSAAGLSTVTLTLHDRDNTIEQLIEGSGAGSKRIPPSKTPGEIAVTRKLFRDGTSQYILNGKSVRLRDVQDLFLGTGLGPNHYAIIEQGRIGQLLASRPVDRRAFVEEAAGVTRFGARRRLAELKLANSTLNLERVHDILQEVRRQASSLKRQAERAQRHATYLEQLREAGGLVYAGRHRELLAEHGRLAAETETALTVLTELSAETARMETEFADKRDREQDWESRLESEREELAALRIEEERMRERADQQARTVAENEARCEQAGLDLQAVAARIESLQEGIAGQGQVVDELDAESKALGNRLERKEGECKAEDASLAELQASQEACRQGQFETLEAISNTRGELGKLEETLAGIERALSEAGARRAESEAELARARESRERLQEQSGDLGRQVAEGSERRDTLGAELAKHGEALEGLRADAERQRSEISRLAARRDSLREMLDHRAYTTEAVKDIFDELERNPRPDFRPLGILADFLEVDEGWEKAVEQFLGDDLEYVVVGDWNEAGAGAQLVREDLGSRAAFFVRTDERPAKGASRSAPEGCRPLSDCVRLVGRDGGRSPGQLPKLACGYLAEDSATAEKLARENPELYFVLEDGTWYQGNTVHVGRKVSSGPLVLKQQVREIVPQLQDAEQELARLDEAILSAEEAAQRDGAELDAVRSSLDSLEREALAVGHGLRQAAEAVESLEAALVASAEHVELTEKQRAEDESRRESALSAKVRLEGEYAESQSRVADLTEAARESRIKLARLNEEQVAIRTEAAALDERLRAARAALAQSEGLLDEQQQRQQSVQGQVEQWRAENQRLVQDNEALATRIETGGKRQEELRDRVERAAESLKESRQSTSELIEAVRDQRSRVETARQQCSAKEIELGRAQTDLDHLALACETELGEKIAAVESVAPADLSAEAIEEAEDRQRRAKERIERLGPVNPLAREEYEEVSQRAEFLETHEQDLTDAIANTKQAIREIEVASRERFDAAFEAINENFRAMFATLFGGGIGELRLTDPEQPGESGVDIVAQPPGKRLQNVALLSGGEKSLTVMALLLATFRYQPSPFCILDEADSQLDEANTMRLRRLLQEMAPETQFIVITHSKTTMEVAGSLYGVTMGEAGVSKLVSVRMSDTGAGTERPALANSA